MAKAIPLEKIFEAWSAIGSGRVRLHDPADADSGTATIISSDGQKTYEARWTENTYACNDNATFWQGYPGYPVIAILMLQGKIPYDGTEGELFAGVDWHKANLEAGRNYALALENVLTALGLTEEKKTRVLERARAVLDALVTLDIHVKRYYPAKKK